MAIKEDFMNRPVPGNIEAEQAVLGAMLLDKDKILEVMDVLSPDDFLEDNHRLLYETIATLFNEGKAIDLLTLGERLEMIGLMEQIGFAYITGLINTTPSASHALYYAKIVREKSKLRKIMHKSHELANRAQQGIEADMPELLLDIEQEMNGLVDVNKNKIVDVAPLIVKLSEEMIEFKMGKRTSISTGFANLDRIVDGFIVPHIWMIGGYTGQGKTFFTLALLRNLMKNGMKPILFSTENSATRNILRLLGCITNLSEMKLYKGKFTDEEQALIDEAKEELKGFSLIVYDNVFDIAEIRLKAKKHKIKNGSNVIVIDYIQNLNINGKGEIYQQMSNVALEIQKISIELNMGVIGVSQINNSNAQEKEGVVIPFKGAGEISAVADVGIWLRRHNKIRHKLMALIMKVRHGTSGTVLFDFFEKDPEGKIIKYLKESENQTL